MTLDTLRNSGDHFSLIRFQRDHIEFVRVCAWIADENPSHLASPVRTQCVLAILAATSHFSHSHQFGNVLANDFWSLETFFIVGGWYSENACGPL